MVNKNSQILFLRRSLLKFFSTAVFICHFSSAANAEEPSCAKVFQTETRSFSRTNKTQFGHLQGSQWIRFRQDIVGFWRFYKSFLQTHIAFQKLGLSRGDVHLENYDALIKKEVRFVFDDLDHFGYGPLLGDFLRAAAGTNLRHASLPPRQLFEIYLLGLAGKAPHISPELQKKIKSIDQEKLRKKDIDDLTSDEKFKNSSENIRRKDWGQKQKDLYEQLQSLLYERYTKIEILDQIIFRKTDGGSLSQLRFRVLAKIQGEKRILEFKFLPQVSALDHITRQPEVDLLLQHLNSESKDLKLMSLVYEFNQQDGRIFLTRERRANLFEELNLTETQQIELAHALIQELGFWQSQQTIAKEYLAILNRDSETIKNIADSFVQAYLQRLFR